MRSAALSGLAVGAAAEGATPTAANRLFPTDTPGPDWQTFPAEGFGQPACGAVYRLKDRVTNGMALGGIDTGCLDLETSGLLGYCTIFNTHVPRRGPLNAPILGISVAGKTWVLCDNQPKRGWGEYQVDKQGVSRIHADGLPEALDGVEQAREIHYWGHYPVADLEFETSAPISVGLRAYSPFLPGDLVGSMLPGAVFEAHLRNTSGERQSATIAFSFPGPLAEEAGSARFARAEERSGSFRGVSVSGPLASYALGVAGAAQPRFGGPLTDGGAWASIAHALPQAGEEEPGASCALNVTLAAGQSRIVRFVLAWHAPTWNAGGYNWANAPVKFTGSYHWEKELHSFTHMYARHYPSALGSAARLARGATSILRRILAWQQAIYSEAGLPVWLRDSLVNNLYLITETGLWAQKSATLPDWVREEDGLFGMNECPRGCPQIECIPCSFYGNAPVIYFFPQLALSTFRGYKGYQFADGAPPWIFGGCTGRTPPIDFANTTRGYQFATNGISLAAMLDRYYLCWGEKEKEFVREFHPVLKSAMTWSVNLRPEYPIGERIIAMPTGNVGTEWFEAPEPGWAGMTAHVGDLRLAQLRISERFATLAGDTAFAQQCRDWLKAALEAMETKLWADGYYLNYFEPETGRKSDLVFGYQLDGEWIIDHHALPAGLPRARVEATLETIKRCNVVLTRYGAVNYANPDGTAAQVKGYGTYSFFPPEALMLAMTYMYAGQREFGLELARKVWHNLICLQGYTWDMPNIMRGDVDTGERVFGNDYYQDMMLWSLPAAIAGQDFGAPVRPGGLVDRMLKAARTA